MIQKFLKFIFLFRCVVSGSGKITMHVLEKLIAYDSAFPISVSGNFGSVRSERT